MGLNLNSSVYFLCRGGSDIIDVDSISCRIEEGIRYLDNTRLRNIIHDLYSHKRKRKLIHITATAACHLAHRYGSTGLALPFAIGDFGLTNVYQTFRKGLATLLVTSAGSLLVIVNCKFYRSS